jgi:hypothetical protein
MPTWEQIKRGIFAGESGGDYGALFGFSNRPGGPFANTNLTNMTVDQALAFADPSGPYAQFVKRKVGRVATPMGAYQIVGSTLRDAKQGLGLTGSEMMSPEMQDRLGQYVLNTQGTGAWEGYKGPQPVGPNRYPNLPDGPKGQEAYPAFGSMAPGNAGYFPPAPPDREVTNYATGDKKPTLGDRISGFGKGLSEAMEGIRAPAIRPMGGDARQSGNMLTQFLNQPPVQNDMLRKRLQSFYQ